MFKHQVSTVAAAAAAGRAPVKPVTDYQ